MNDNKMSICRPAIPRLRPTDFRASVFLTKSRVAGGHPSSPPRARVIIFALGDILFLFVSSTHRYFLYTRFPPSDSDPENPRDRFRQTIYFGVFLLLKQTFETGDFD